MYHQRASAFEKGVARIIRLASGITVNAIQRNTREDLKNPISWNLPLVLFGVH
jgi:hypothetical protein